MIASVCRCQFRRLGVRYNKARRIFKDVEIPNSKVMSRLVVASFSARRMSQAKAIQMVVQMVGQSLPILTTPPKISRFRR